MAAVPYPEEPSEELKCLQAIHAGQLTPKKRRRPHLEGVQGALLPPGGQEIVPGQVLLLLAHGDQQVHGRPAGLGRGKLGQRGHQLAQKLLHMRGVGLMVRGLWGRN